MSVQSTPALGASFPPQGKTGNSALSNGVLLSAQGLHRTFRSGGSTIAPVNGIDFTIQSGEMVAIIGPSGAGKSTFLHLLAALDTPTSGAIYFERNSLESLSEHELSEYRGRKIGFVWQRHHLLPDFTAVENVAMPLFILGIRREAGLKRAQDLLNEVGLGDRGHHRAGELSGGEQQRVAIARALVNDPKLLLADEPTGDLDERNAELIFELIATLHSTHRLTSILATHNLSIAGKADRLLKLEHGKLSAIGQTADVKAASGVQANFPKERG
jgi:lipoprotein-releasing system ATP-binding protein